MISGGEGGLRNERFPCNAPKAEVIEHAADEGAQPLKHAVLIRDAKDDPETRSSYLDTEW